MQPAEDRPSVVTDVADPATSRGARTGAALIPEPAVVERLRAHGTLGQQVQRSVAWTAGTRVLVVAAQLVTQALVMRLLLTSDYGLVAITATVTGFAAFFTDLGLTTALVQAPRLTDRLLRTAFWLNTVVGIVVTAVVLAAAPLVAALYGDADITSLLRVGALAFALNVAAVPVALLQRTLQFRALVSAEVGATVCGLVTTLVLAHRGGGAMSLVIGPLVEVVLLDVLLWSVVRWSPAGGFLHREELAHLWRFGRGVSGANLLYFASRNVDTLMLGAVVPVGQLGLYDRSYKIMMLPVTQVTTVLTRVMLPAFSRMQDDRTQLRRAWTTTTRASLLFGIPLGIGVAVTAPALVETVYGSRWAGMVPTLVLLGVSVPAQLVARNSGPVYQALGRTGLQFRTAVVSAAVTVAGIGAALPWGIVGVAASLVVTSALGMVVGLVPLMRALRTSTGQVWSAVRGCVFAGGCMAAAALAAGWATADAPAPLVLLVQVCAGAGAYAAALWLVERSLVTAVLARLPRRG